MSEYQTTSQTLPNVWDDLIQHLKECSEWDQGSKKIPDLGESITKDRKITLEDAIFIILNGSAKVNDFEYLRRLN